MDTFDRDEKISKIASEFSEVLCFEGIGHCLYLPNEVNDGVSLLSDSQQPFDMVPFENLIPNRWDMAISHNDEEGSSPFVVLRVFEGESPKIHIMQIKDIMECASTIADCLRVK